MSENVNALDATAQAALIAKGEVSPREMVDAAIAQAEKVNGNINAIIHPRFDRARDEIEGGLPTGPFTGVPLVIKDLGAAIGGEPHHMGTRFLKNANYIAPYDSYLTRRFRNAGFVIIGRTNTPEFGNTITTEPLSYGPSRNPWNLDHSTGGSSGGSAASVAAHIVSVGHANDGGGSIRIPASECGLVGLKPSRGRVSKGPDVGESWMGSTIDGCVTRTVRDTAAVLDVICGYEPGDPYVAPPFARPLTQELGVNPGKLRIGVLDHPVYSHQKNDAESRESIKRTVDVLTALGHEVELTWPKALEEVEVSGKFTAIVGAATHADVSAFEQLMGRTIGEGDMEPDNLLMRELGRSISVDTYINNQMWLHAWCRRVVQWWEPLDGSRGFDILVTPTLAGPPPRIGHLAGENGSRHLVEILAFTSQFNLTGQPAISLPLHWSSTGLPMGVQFVAAPFREDVLVRLASQLEEAMPWRDRVAPLVANS
jgi:amidase